MGFQRNSPGRKNQGAWVINIEIKRRGVYRIITCKCPSNLESRVILMKVKFYANLRDISKVKEMSVSGPKNIKELLLFLSSEYGKEMKKKFLTENNEIHSDIIILVNGRHVDHLQWGETKLCSTDVISLFPRIAGG